MNKIFGYCRVSTKNQHLDRQISNIKEHFPFAIFYSVDLYENYATKTQTKVNVRRDNPRE